MLSGSDSYFSLLVESSLGSGSLPLMLVCVAVAGAGCGNDIDSMFGDAPAVKADAGGVDDAATDVGVVGADAYDSDSGGRCEILGVSYSDGELNPANSCQMCDFSNPTRWTIALREGSPCGNDMHCDGEGLCRPGCGIDDSFYEFGTAHPSNECLLCSQSNQTTWTKREAGSPCGGASSLMRCDPDARCVRYLAVSAGGLHTCAVNGVGSVFCWGSNQHGQIGSETSPFIHVEEPVRVFEGDDGAKKIATGWIHSCAVMLDGSVRCWGANSDGQVGDGSTSDRFSPITVLGPSVGVVEIGVSDSHSCVVRSSGQLVCWGKNTDGQIGDQTTINRLSPVTADGVPLGMVAVAPGASHTCALDSLGKVWCWGGNAYGQLGDGSVTGRVTAEVVSIATDIVAIDSGPYHTCALDTSGDLYCWGRNSNGELGLGVSVAAVEPAVISTFPRKIRAVATEMHVCAIDTLDALYCWGQNNVGEAGECSGTSCFLPALIPQLSSGVISVSVGGMHTCDVNAQNAVSCWGANGMGQLGIGTSVDRAIPDSVVVIPSD